MTGPGRAGTTCTSPGFGVNGSHTVAHVLKVVLNIKTDQAFVLDDHDACLAHPSSFLLSS